MSNPDLCLSCKSSGLAMHFGLALPVPQSCGAPAIPSWAVPGKLAPIAMTGYAYCLRSLRQGFLYVFYEKNQYGSNKWLVWDVSVDGQMYPMADPSWTIPVAGIPCTRTGHSVSRLHHIVIEAPHKCGTSWAAFSENQWSAETLKRYQDNKALRAERMLSFEPAQLIASDAPAGPHLTAGSPAAFAGISDYGSAALFSKLPFEQPASLIKPISTHEDGQFSAKALEDFHSTRYPWAKDRQGTADKAAEMLKSRSKKLDGTQHPGVVMALPDAIGCVHEMNGYRNDVAGCIARYSDERGMQMTAANTFDGLEQAFKERALDSIEQPWKWTAQNTATRLQGIKPGASAEERDLEKDLCARWERDAAARAPYSLAQQRSTNIQRGRVAYEADQVRIDKGIAARQKTLANNPQISKDRQASADQSAKSDYENCLQRVDKTALKTFKDNWKKFTDATESEVDKRTVELIKWLEAPALLTALEDFAPTSVADGIVFEDTIGSAIMGIGSSKAGRAKIKAWAEEMKATKGNLLWRAVALNQDAGKEDLNTALTMAKEAHGKRELATALTVEGMIAKTMKALADIYKKADGILNANDSATNAKGSYAYGAKINAIRSYGIDKFLVTVGDTLVDVFGVKHKADHLSEYILHRVFSLRAFVDQQDSKSLLVAIAAHQTEARGQLLQRLSKADTFLAADTPHIKTVQTQAMHDAWNDFKTNNSKGTTAIKDARLAVFVMLIEAVNTQKLLTECYTKGDSKSYWALAASAMTISSGLFDVASAPAKHLFGNPSVDMPAGQSWSYQKIKFWGGLLSGAATFIGAGLDLWDAKKAGDKGQILLRNLYGFKVILGVGSLVFTAATTFTYAAPYIQRLAGGQVMTGASRVVGARAAAIIGARILCMGIGAWITVGTIAVQGLIWIFTPNALNQWASLCTFGKERKSSDGYSSLKTQQKALESALAEVGVAG
jgi:hypothetical protein